MKKFQIPKLLKAKSEGRKIVSLTAYDAFTARLLDRTQIDFILVGDSLGNVIQGKETTLPVTVEELIYHTRIVVENAPNSLVIADMPFASFGLTVKDGAANCARVMKETGCGAVKIEGVSMVILETIKEIVSLGVPVMGHTGFLPQRVNVFGGYKVLGKDAESEERVYEESKDLEEAGCFSVVLECVIDSLAKKITESLSVPTIGIGSGVHCDGQILVITDLLGLSFDKLPSFVPRYVELGKDAERAVAQFAEEVRAGKYPGPGQSYEGNNNSR